MKRSVTKVTLFFVVLAASAAALDRCVNTGLRRMAVGECGVSNQMLNGTINTEILINGSSRALCHYDPRIIEATTSLKAFNIGHNASQTDVQLAMLKTYLKHNSKPRLVIQNLDSFTFERSRQIYDPAK